MDAGFFLSIASGAAWDFIKKGASLTKDALRKKLSKWLADDVISEIYASIEKAPPFCLDSKEKIEAYLKMNSDLISRFDHTAGEVNTCNTIYQDAHDVSGVMAGVINGPVTQYANAEMPREAGSEPFSVLQDYLRSRAVQVVKSYSAIRDTPQVGASEEGVLYVQSTFVPPAREVPPAAFVMTLLSYIPPENWTKFASHGKQMKFVIEVSQGVEAVQLQIKDSKQKQFIDIALNTQNNKVVFSRELTGLAPLDAWKDVGEICFTIFSENCSAWGQPFSCKVADFYLI